MTLSDADLDAIEARGQQAFVEGGVFRSCWNDVALEDARALIAALREARALLRHFEYVGCAHDSGAVCRECGAGDWERTGHRAGCRMAAALGMPIPAPESQI